MPGPIDAHGHEIGVLLDLIASPTLEPCNATALSAKYDGPASATAAGTSESESVRAQICGYSKLAAKGLLYSETRAIPDPIWGYYVGVVGVHDLNSRGPNHASGTPRASVCQS